MNKVWMVPVGVGVLLCAVVIVRECNAPAPNDLRQAAARAASAIVTVQQADTALAQHYRSITTAGIVAAKLTPTRARLDSVIPDPVRIATQDTVITGQDSVIAVLTKDNTELATALQTTRDTLAPYRTPITPARASIFSRVVSKLIVPTVGYGAVYDGKTVFHGPGVAVGLQVTSGMIGVTAGLGAVYANGGVHAGATATLGLRVHL